MTTGLEEFWFVVEDGNRNLSDKLTRLERVRRYFHWRWPKGALKTEENLWSIRKVFYSSSADESFTLRMNDRWRKSSAGKSLRTTFDKKWQWLITLEGSSRDKSALNFHFPRKNKENFIESLNEHSQTNFSKFERTFWSAGVKWINGNTVMNWFVDGEKWFSSKRKKNEISMFSLSFSFTFSSRDDIRRQMSRRFKNSSCCRPIRRNGRFVSIRNTFWWLILA